MQPIYEKKVWDNCGYAQRRDPPSVAGVSAPSETVQLNKWLFKSALWAEKARDAIDARQLRSIQELLPLLPYFAVDGYVLGDGCQFCCFTSDQMLKALGWGNDGKKLRRAVRALTLQTSGADSTALTKACRKLRDDGVQPLLELRDQGVKGLHGTVYAFVGIEPLPPSPDESDPDTPPDKPGLAGSSHRPKDSESGCLPAETAFHGNRPVPPNKSGLGGLSPELGGLSRPVGEDAPPSVISYQSSSVVSPGAAEDAGVNDNDNNEVMDREECFQQIVGLFPGGVGKLGLPG